MFDIGFWEIIVISVVALFVVGPERFPGMIKQAGYWLRQFRRMASTVKTEFEQEVDKADKLQALLEEQKQIVERNVKIDLTQPAVKPKQASSTLPDTSGVATPGIKPSTKLSTTQGQPSQDLESEAKPATSEHPSINTVQK